jgi:sugar-specific transcriptional regulator TrmB
MKKISPLISLGLHVEESRVYEELIVRGPLSPTELCAFTGIHRPTLYNALTHLEKKNLVSVVPSGKRKHYIANSPKILKDLSSQQNKVIQDEIIRLEELTTTTKHVPKVTVRQGTEAIRTIYQEMVQELSRGDTYYRYAAIDSERWTPGFYVRSRSKHIRDAKQLQRFIITNEDTKKRKTNNPNRVIKTVPNKYNLLRYNVSQLMYANKVVIIDYNNEIAVIIENDPIAEFQKAIFKTLFHYL